MPQNHADWSVKLVEAELKLPGTAALALTLPAERGQPIGRDTECGAFVSGQARDVAEEGLFVGVERDDHVRGDRKSTASSVGTSTPSLRQRAFVRMRHTGTSSVPAPSVSQSILRARTAAFIVPSTWRHSTCRLSDDRRC